MGSDFRAPLFLLPIDTWCNTVIKFRSNVRPTKFSGLDGLSYFLTYGCSVGALRALKLRYYTSGTAGLIGINEMLVVGYLFSKYLLYESNRDQIKETEPICLVDSL